MNKNIKVEYENFKLKKKKKKDITTKHKYYLYIKKNNKKFIEGDTTMSFSSGGFFN